MYQRPGNQQDWQIDQEYRLPAELTGKHTAYQRSDRRRCAHDRTEVTENARVPVLGNDISQQCHCIRHQHRAAGSHQYP